MKLIVPGTLSVINGSSVHATGAIYRDSKIAADGDDMIVDGRELTVEGDIVYGISAKCDRTSHLSCEKIHEES